MESKVYNQKGEEAGKISLPENIFGVKWNSDLLHQVVTSMLSNKRNSTAHTKDRSEVRGGGRKPWKQKGTGRARHGSSRSPIWIGGGVTHGPRNEKSYSKKINKKMRSKALFVALSQKYRDGEIFFVDKLILPEIKTQKAKELVSSLSKIKGLEILNRNKKRQNQIALFNIDATILKSFRNVPSIYLSNVKNLNPAEILNHKNVIIVEPEKAIKFLESRMK